MKSYYQCQEICQNFKIEGPGGFRVTWRTKFAFNGVPLVALEFITAKAQGPTRSQEVAGMYLNQRVTARQAVVACASLLGLLTLGGCSMFHHRQDTAAAPPPVVAPQTETTTPEPQTVTDAMSDTDDESGTTTVMRDAGPALKAGAPKDYVVKRGDTLWGIANMFLRDPWLWPEIWYVNPGIHNPHRIYPGDTVHLALSSDGRMALQVVHGNLGPVARLSPLLRSAEEEGPIEAIPYSIIGAFLSRPGVMSRDEISAAPYVVALRDDDQVAGAGHDVYVKKVTGDQGTRYNVMHIDEELQDPQSHRHLGYMAIYTGTAQISRPGDVARARLVDSARETLQGDVLVADSSTSTADFHPHIPSQAVDGRIIAVIDNVMLAGQYEIVALNRGSSDGLDRGTVLTADSYPQKVADHCASIEERSTCVLAHSVVLPEEKEATLLVFKTYEQMSYALIVQDDYPIKMFDRVRTP